MVECNCTSSTVFQQVGKNQCNESHDSCDNNRVSVFNRWRQMFQNIWADAKVGVYKHDGYESVPLGGGSVMHIRCEPEAIFREGK